MNALPPLVRCLTLLMALGLLSSCSELQARRHAREGNRLYREANYSAAVHEYNEAEQLHSGLAVVAFNKGLACRQLMIPGVRTAANDRAIDCALRSFAHFKKLSPEDPRGESLYMQTLFDAGRFETLASIYQRELKAHPRNPEAINGLIQVYSRWNRPDEALRWTIRRAELRPRDAEAQYAVGVFIYNLLFEKGGSPDKSSFDPRPEAAEQKMPPLFTVGDIVGRERVRLAELGMSHLRRALAIRPNYHDAMTYLNLLYRQKSFAFFDRPLEWQASVDAAETWRKKAMQGLVKGTK